MLFFGYIKRPIAVLLITVALIIFGLVSLSQISQDLMPAVNQPVLVVEIEGQDMSPSDLKRLATEPLERSLSSLKNLKEMESFITPELSVTRLVFSWEASLDQASFEIRESLDALRFPAGIKKPRILHYDPTLRPILRLSFSSSFQTTDQLRAIIVKNIRPVLESIQGVATTSVKGGEEQEVIIEIKSSSLQSQNLSIPEVSKKIKDNIVSLPSGSLEQSGKIIYLRVEARASSLEELRNLPIKSNGSRVVLLRDIATVKMSQDLPESITRTNLESAVLLDVFRQSDANIVEVSELVTRTTRNLGKKTWMQSIDLEVVEDQSVYIKGAINNVSNSIGYGALLAFLVLLAFLGKVTSAIIIGLAIPIVVPITIFLLHRQGISLNYMSLGGLALGVGMLVDNSIVVLENIYRHGSLGKSNLEAAIEGTKEVIFPIVASTLTSLVVFFPLIYVKGIAGQLFSDLAYTVIYSLSISLMIAIFVLPTAIYVLESTIQKRALTKNKNAIFSFKKILNQFEVIKRILKIKNASSAKGRILKTFLAILVLPVALIADLLLFCKFLALFLLMAILYLWKFIRPVADIIFVSSQKLIQSQTDKIAASIYPFLLRKNLKFPVFLIALIGIGSYLAYSTFMKLDKDLLPSISDKQILIEGEVEVGANLRKASTTSFAIESKVKKLKGVKNVTAIVGKTDSDTMQGKAGVHKFKIQIATNPQKFKESTLRKTLQSFKGINWKLSQPGVGIYLDPIQAILIAPDKKELKEKNKTFKEILTQIDGLELIGSTEFAPLTDYKLTLNSPALQLHQITANELVQFLKSFIKGTVVGELDKSIQTNPIRVRGKKPKNVNELLALNFQKGQKQIPLSSLVELEEVEAPTSIYTNNSMLATKFSLENTLPNLDASLNALTGLLTSKSLFGIEIKGKSADYEESMTFLALAMILAVFFVYIVLGCQFESFLMPLIIIASIPLSLIGAILGLYVFNVPLSLISLIGCVVLVGIIVNNAIILIDFTLRLYRSGKPIINATLEAASVRFRPIIMTTTTTVLGLIPLSLSYGDGSILSRSIGMPILGGLVLGTLLTLFLIPSLTVVALKVSK